MRLLITSIMTIAIFLLAGDAISQERVQAIGVGATERLARQDAYVNAIEQVFGVSVNKETVTENFRLVKHVVLVESRGYVESYDVVSSERLESGDFQVTIDALVNEGRISNLDHLKTLIQLMGNPSIMVAITPASASTSFGVDHLTSIIRRDLSGAGFRVVDPPAGDYQRLEQPREIAQANNVDVLITGKLTSVTGEPYGDPNFPITDASVTLSLEVVNVLDWRTLVALPSVSQTAASQNAEAALKQAIDELYREDKLRDKLLYTMPAEMGPPFDFELQVSAGDCSRMMDIMQSLQSLSSVEHTELSSCAEGDILYLVRSYSQAPELGMLVTDILGHGASLMGLKGKRIEIELTD
ncbi:hypothetical protein GF377_01880 [candidate division GN15 bacterium]|nr:hypothetical protein [candidate division GN15 bacterium]